jgi:hypothetical protein
MKDLYATLGVSRRATGREIKSAYRRLARRYHPDVSASPDANAEFARISEAYHVLTDPRLRAAYDRGEYVTASRTFYASREAEVVAKKREFDRVVDEMIAHERQEAAARSQAVLLVVPLFLSTFYVMAVRPTFIQDAKLVGRIIIVGLAIYGLVYLVRNIAIVLARYTYHVPDHLTSVFQEEAPPDKPISRKAGLSFIVCGYLVSLGLGYVAGQLVPWSYGARVSAVTVLGVLLYPPIAVLLVGGIRRIGNFLERS